MIMVITVYGNVLTLTMETMYFFVNTYELQITSLRNYVKLQKKMCENL